MKHNNHKGKKRGQGIYFVLQGKLIIIQKSTQTFITELGESEVFGQISFFSGAPRSVTVRSRGFTELMHLDQVEFLKTIHEKHIPAIRRYEQLRYSLI